MSREHELRHHLRVLAKLATTHRDAAKRFDGYHHTMISRGEASNWNDRSSEEEEIADALDAILALTSGGSNG